MSELSFEMGEGQRRTYRALRGVLTAGARAWFRLSIRGEHNVPAAGGFILTPGAHRSIIDTPLVGLAVTDRELRFMGADNYFEIPGLGVVLPALGGFPVERGANDRAAMRLAQTMLEQGEPLVVFPEGTRHRGAEVAPIKHGAAFLACRAGVPLVPMGIGGAERSLPIGGRFPRPTRIALVVGEPIHPPVIAPGEPVRRSAVADLTEQLQTRLQTLFNEAQDDAGA